MSWATERRLDFIDWRLKTYGEVRREHLIAAFDISMPQASGDLGAFDRAYPGAMEYDKSRKLYAPAKTPYRSRREFARDKAGNLIFTINT
jgi:hypothetical protein